MLRQALSLCASITQEADRFEAAFFESVRVLVQRLRSAGAGKKISLKEMNDRINALLNKASGAKASSICFPMFPGSFLFLTQRFLRKLRG